jgi:AcrR family transcriptional regulator
MTQRRLPPAQRRAHIAEAARQAIMRDGLRKTGLREIARQAGTSVGTVTYHFAGINEIFVEAAVLEVDRFYAPVVSAADAEPDAARAVEILLAPLFDGTDDADRHWRFWSDYWSASAQNAQMNEAGLARLHLWRTCLERTVQRGIGDGSFPAGIDPAAIAIKTSAYANGIFTQLSLGAPGLDHATARTWMSGFLQAEVGCKH